MRWSESQRRFWNTVNSFPAARACSTSAAASSAEGASGLSTTTASPASSPRRASGTWASFRAAITAKSCSPARSHTSSALGTTRAPGFSRSAWSRRPGSRVTIVATSRPGVAAISGAWKTEPASP